MERYSQPRHCRERYPKSRAREAHLRNRRNGPRAKGDGRGNYLNLHAAVGRGEWWETGVRDRLGD